MTPLQNALDSYLTMRRSLGYKLTTQEQRLRGFVAFMSQRSAQTLTAKLAVEWAGSQCGPATWSSRLSTVRSFARHVQMLDPRTEIPPSGMFPPQRRRRPYIYAPDEIDDLLRALPSLVPTPYQARTYCQFLALLATTGMRFSEGVNLTRADVDFTAGLVTIRETKFAKTRIIPIHHTAIEALKSYADIRDGVKARRDAPHFFAGFKGSFLRHDAIHKPFLTWARRAGIRGPGRWNGPCIHDLRHTFAVRTLIRWYEAGSDVERRLPLLSTYLGHTHVRDTYWYLSATADLLRHASRRFEARWEHAS